MANVYLHAYPAGATGDVELRAQHPPGTLWVDISDEGDWQPPRADCGPWRGRGLVLINQLAGQTAIASTASGTTVSLT
ncbi:ATP-binding protein [Amycolatopsis endophytica]|uniref:ATP-binding protein n=1 Tax=Amycolatopsis endophytica TaxID=860233 RepID=UPI002483D46B|nr:ATP-binding protein [Amycolatopsis endophytica]